MRYAIFVKRSVIGLCLLAICGSLLAQKDDNIAGVQQRLKADGFYYGNPTGVFDTETVEALRRFQIRHRLMVSGKLDTSTARELNATAPKPSPTPETLTGSWRQLANGEMQFVPEQPAATIAPAAIAAPATVSASPPVRRPEAPPPAEGPPVPPPSRTPPPQTTVAQPSSSPSGSDIEAPDRLRDYVEAFVQAGLARPPGSEIRFFAENVDYFGAPNVPRQKIQRDLEGYNQKWPHRRFWIDGNIEIAQERGSNQIKLVFPLRYELHNGGRYASGRVLKSLTLLKTADNEMQITAVNEWKGPEDTGGSQ
ncbi:MAG: peptidoglycan-binding domain-containing protein [Chthoniobacterales bacterium]